MLTTQRSFRPQDHPVDDRFRTLRFEYFGRTHFLLFSRDSLSLFTASLTKLQQISFPNQVILDAFFCQARMTLLLLFEKQIEAFNFCFLGVSGLQFSHQTRALFPK